MQKSDLMDLFRRWITLVGWLRYQSRAHTLSSCSVFLCIHSIHLQWSRVFNQRLMADELAWTHSVCPHGTGIAKMEGPTDTHG